MSAGGAWRRARGRARGLGLGPARGRGLAPSLVLSLGLAACGGVPEAPVTAAPAPVPLAAPRGVEPAQADRFERAWREREREAARRGAWAQAAEAAEVLSLWRPDDPAARAAVQEARAQIDRLLPERVARAQATRRRGELDAAAAQWLAVLQLDPVHAEAAQALREIERERWRRAGGARATRDAAREMGPARAATPPARAGTAAARTPPAPPTGAKGPATAGSVSDQADAEHLALLVRQGEWSEALALARRLQAEAPADPARRRRLADLLVAQAEALPAADPAAAEAVRQALTLVPGHAGALGWQRRVREPAAGGRR